MNNASEPKSLKGSKTTVTWHMECSIYLLRRIEEKEIEEKHQIYPGERRHQVRLDHKIMGTTNIESHTMKKTNYTGMNEKCNVNS